MKINILLAMGLLFGACFPTPAAVLPVPGTYPTIQSAIDAAADGDTILVDNGTYFENLNFRGKSVILASQFIFSGELSDIANTIIDGSQPADPDSASCIIIAKASLALSTDTVPAVIGFTITHGSGTVWEDEHGPGLWYREGGGILLWSTVASIRNNIFWGNDATSLGSQIYTKGGSTVSVEYSDVMGGYLGTGNINLEPAFTDTAYIPSALSPCIDAGDPDPDYHDPANPLSPEQALYPARGGLHNDMGAYGGPGSRLLDGFLTVGIMEENPGTGSIFPLTIFPNPAGEKAIIRFYSDNEVNGSVNLTHPDGKVIVAN